MLRKRGLGCFDLRNLQQVVDKMCKSLGFLVENFEESPVI